MDFPLLHIEVEQMIPKRRDVVMPIVGNAFVMSLPFSDLPRILDKTESTILFESVSIFPGPWIRRKGKMELFEEGAKTRAVCKINLTGLLMLTYFLHWVAGFGLWLVENLWAHLFGSSFPSLVTGWVFFLLLIWPGLLFLLMRRMQKLRLKTFMRNLVYHS